MNKFNKNDRIIVTNGIWKDKEGIILKTLGDEYEQQYYVKIFFDSKVEDKNIIEILDEKDLIICSANENLNEFLKPIQTEKDFINHFINQQAIFLGLNYTEIFNLYRQDDDTYDYSAEDSEAINYYKQFENKNCKIINCSLGGSFNVNSTLEENFNASYWDLEFDDNEVLLTIAGEFIQLLDTKYLTETLDNNIDIDIIHDYVYTENIDNKIIPSWFFADKICGVENISINELIDKAKNLNYGVYKLYSIKFNKIILSAPEITAENILDDYADYSHENISVKKL